MKTVVKVTQPSTLMNVLIEAEIPESRVAELMAVIERLKKRDWSGWPELVRQQGQDGVAHMAFYDAERELSFVWDGTQGSEVEVAYGGYGEPVIAVFEWMASEDDLTQRSGLSDFERVCRDWS